MIADFRWEPLRYSYQWKYVPDEKTRCGCLVLYKTVEVNCFGETREEIENEN